MNRFDFTVSMLGEFEICLNGKSISEPLARSKKVKHLLEYLLHRRCLVPMAELYDVF